MGRKSNELEHAVVETVFGCGGNAAQTTGLQVVALIMEGKPSIGAGAFHALDV
jgi:hypothetical protein